MILLSLFTNVWELFYSSKYHSTYSIISRELIVILNRIMENKKHFTFSSAKRDKTKKKKRQIKNGLKKKSNQRISKQNR